MKKIIETQNAPAPIGPYNQAVRVGNLVYVSGQIAINPFTGAIMDSSIEEETRQVMDNIGAVLEAAGASFDQVVKCSIFLIDIADFPRVNQVYGEYFKKDFPARETVEVNALPKNVNVEISCIAFID